MLLRIEATSPMWLLLSALAGFRVVTLICFEAGPFGCMVGFRRLLYSIGLKSLVDCFHCCAVWIAAGVVLLVYEPRRESAIVALSVAGAISVIQRWLVGAGDAAGSA